MINKIANGIVRKLEEKNLLITDKRRENVYAIVTILEKWITLSSIMVLSIILDKIVYTVLFLLFFYVLRQRTGGYHAKTFGICYIESIMLYIFMVYFIHTIPINVKYILLLTVVAGGIIYFIGALNSIAMDMNEAELKQSKIMAGYILLDEEIVVFVLVFLNVNREVIVYCCMAIILCAILMCMAKILKQDVVF